MSLSPLESVKILPSGRSLIIVQFLKYLNNEQVSQRVVLSNNLTTDYWAIQIRFTILKQWRKAKSTSVVVFILLTDLNY